MKGKKVACVAKDRDANSRIVAVCYVDGADVSAALVEEGFAWAFVPYSSDYVTLELAAQKNGIGIWQGSAVTP